MDPLTLAIAAGISLGLVIGYRCSRVVVDRVGGPFARGPLVVGCAIAGAIGFLVPAFLFSYFISRNFVASRGAFAGAVPVPVSSGLLLGIAAGNALVIASGLVVGTFAGGLCARMIEEARVRL